MGWIMSTLQSSQKECWRYCLRAIFLLIWLVPGTAFSDSNYIEIIGTIVPVEQQHGHNVYKLQSNGQRLYFSIADLKSSASNYTIQDEWYYFKRQSHRRLRLAGDKELIKQLKVGKLFDTVKISGYFNYSTGLFRVRNLEPVKNDILLASCSS